MRRSRTALLLAIGLSLAATRDTAAKFGISKTKVTLQRTRPPDIPLLGETAAVEVDAGRRVSEAAVALVRGRMREGLEASGIRVVDRGREAEAAVKVELEDVEARLQDNVIYEDKYVKIGEKQVWNEKKKKYETKDVWGNRKAPVTQTTATGSLTAQVEVTTGGDTRTADASASYNDQFKRDGKIPMEASSELSLERYLVEEAAARAVAAVAFSPDPVEALLAVDGELKDGNRLAQAGLFDQALREWSKRKLKGDKEAARLHNVGVAHEALAYQLPLHTSEHRARLDQAREHYQMALSLDPGEKYFAEPVDRIEASLSYATAAARIAEDRERHASTRGRRDRPDPVAARPAPRASKEPAPRMTDVPRAAAPPAALRNGSFESSMEGWTVTGTGTAVREGTRGRVAELSSTATAATLNQAMALDLGSAAGASLSLEYRITAGEPRIVVLLGYADQGGRERTSTLQVTAGEAPGGWSPWTGDVAALRPRPAHVKDVRILVEGGTARVDNVALTLR